MPKLTLYDLLHNSEAKNDNAKTSLTFFNDLQTFELLTNQLAQFALAHNEPDSVFVIDKYSAKSVTDILNSFTNASKPFFILDPKNALTTESEFILAETDRLLMMTSPSIAVLLAASVDDTSFHACWTDNADLVRDAVKLLVESYGIPEGFGGVNKQVGQSKDYENLLRITTALLDHLAHRERNAAVEKQDLQAVLDILKALSVKRRCHDVLFVFVEQVAKVLGTDRCSVVRIWNGARTGNVLASHDNARLTDLLIDLSKYPEVTRAIETERTVNILDIDTDPLVASYREDLHKANIRAIAVIPITLHDMNVGSLLLRVARSSGCFLPRDISFCEIVAEAAANALERAYLFDTIQRANERLEHLAITDDLTGLRNHRAFRESLEREFERARRYKHALSVLIIDLDNFKRINDTYGHLQGDAVLKELSQRIMRIVRKSDVAARYGGEEIVVVMPQTALEGAYAQACRLLTELSRPPYPGIPAEHPVTVSIGVATLDHDKMLDCESLIRLADSALYVAKRNGKNQAVIGRQE